MDKIKFKKDLVERLAKGEVNVEWDKSLPVEQLQELLMIAFPQDEKPSTGKNKFYGQHRYVTDKWACSDIRDDSYFATSTSLPFRDFIEVEEKHPEFTPNGMLPMGGFEMRFMPSDAMDKGRAIVLVHPDDFETVKNHFDQRFKTS